MPAITGIWLAALVTTEPARSTAADRLEGIEPEASKAFLAMLETNPAQLSAFFAPLGETVAATDRTDGLRFTLGSNRILHMRPSGNAPEFRLYAEAESHGAAADLLHRGLAALRGALG